METSGSVPCALGGVAASVHSTVVQSGNSSSHGGLRWGLLLPPGLEVTGAHFAGREG